MCPINQDRQVASNRLEARVRHNRTNHSKHRYRWNRYFALFPDNPHIRNKWHSRKKRRSFADRNILPGRDKGFALKQMKGAESCPACGWIRR
jgi:hypothetical protein